MRDMNTTVEPPVTTEDEVVTTPCPSCSTPIERTIPKGTTVKIADWLRALPLTCSKCAAEREQEEERERHEKRVLLRRQNCELPMMLRELDWASYDVSRKGAGAAKAAAEAWARGEHEKRGLMLIGDVGVGKTRLAATAVWAALERIGVRYVNVAELIVKMSAGFGDSDRAEALRVLTGRGPIVLDDLDKVNPSMFVLSNLYTAIEGRIESGTPMIVTTNLRPSKLLEKFAAAGRGENVDERRVAAEAIVSRLRGHCTLHLIEGEDGRR